VVPVIPSSISEYDSFVDAPGYFEDPSPPAKYELYIPAPTDLSREEAFRYHLTTRNFFAWMFDKPVVGDYLGGALIALYERMNEFRPNEEQNEDDILAFIDSQGYTDFRDCCDHALGVLQFAEELELTELWTDAFVHCAGMWGTLDKSAEFAVSVLPHKTRFTFIVPDIFSAHISYLTGFHLEGSPRNGSTIGTCRGFTLQLLGKRSIGCLPWT